MPEPTAGQTRRYKDGDTIVERTRSPQYVQFYINNVEFGMTQWDVRIRLSELTGARQQTIDGEPSKVVSFADLATIVMSPQHAKAFAILFAKNMEAWERENGPITLPKEILEAETERHDANDI